MDQYDRNRLDSMRPTPSRYGFYPVVTEPLKPITCSICDREVSKLVIVNGVGKCEPCFNTRK